MYPTMFHIPFLPGSWGEIKSYGVMMMIAFLTGIWLACRRAYKSQANPDTILNMGFVALICGVVGARAMFVIHYWDTRFANLESPMWAMFDIRAGGLEFWGGPLLVIPALGIYLKYFAKVSVRWYFDIAIPSLAWGLAITRIGCFLNGCCWGAVCLDENDPARQRAAVCWAVRFPYGSPAMQQQYKFGQLALPKELIVVTSSGESAPLQKAVIDALVQEERNGGETLEKLRETKAAAQKAYAQRTASGGDAQTLTRLREMVSNADNAIKGYRQTVGLAATYCQSYGLSPAELGQLADHYRSKPVHPAQLYATINGLMISWVLTSIFYYRKRHGIVVGWFLILYSVSRIFLELIRQDNPLDVGGLTISQAISLGTLAAGVIWLWLMHTRMPLMSPRAAPYVPPEEEAPVQARKVRKAKK